jgi:hypothetical protein
MSASTANSVVRTGPKVPHAGNWKPGVSGNPGGRRDPARISVTELAKTHTEAAIMALVASLKDPKSRVPAATALLNRGWGMPRQHIEATGDGTAVLHLLAAQMVSRELLDQIGDQVAGRRAEMAADRVTIDVDALPTE